MAYDAVYADGKSGTSKGYYGGNNGGATDSSGVWKDTWVVGAAAPPGTVHVDVIAQTRQERAYRSVSFAVANAIGRCA
ncbi:MAG: hypothetical protein ACYDH6_19745 [Acidimicrobiales bacterium]